MLAAWAPLPALAFDYLDVVAKAKALAQAPHRPAAPVGDTLAALDYDQYQQIAYKAEAALWPGSDFQVQFFAPGYLFERPVEIFVVAGGEVRGVAYDPANFDYGESGVTAEQLAGQPNLGYAGFRVHYAEADDARPDEFLVFLGASYWRARGLEMTYGLSARGLAIDTGVAGIDEEFPRFTAFWLLRPEPDAERITLYALLESPSATGAYRFKVSPGAKRVVMDVEATVFLRRPVTKLGLAPLTSMFLYDIGDHRPPAYFRPEVHDSGGLLLTDGGGNWLWRGLDNPYDVAVTSFPQPQPGGFGLLQRERDFAAYQGLVADYQDRPSAWVDPRGDWGPGHVELVELPTAVEWQDNIVALWVPKQQPPPGEALRFAYRLIYDQTGPDHGLAPVSATRSALLADGVHEAFAEFRIPEDAPDPETLRVELTLENVELVDRRLAQDPHYGVYRLRLHLRRKGEGPAEVRAQLHHDGRPITETWVYPVRPLGGPAEPLHP